MAQQDATSAPANGQDEDSGTYDLLTPERVTLQYDLAGIGSRGAALLIDSLWQSVAATVLILALAGLGLLAQASSTVRDAVSSSDTAGIVIAVAVIVALFALILWGYFILFEIIWSGQTPGKRAMGLRVLRENGYPIRPGDAIIRNVLRIVDWLPTTYSVGVLTMLLNGRAKRLGDFAAGTVVVREGRSRPELPVLASTPAGPALGARLTPDEAALTRAFLLRRGMLEPEARRRLAHDLATLLETRYGLAAQHGELADEQILEHLVAEDPSS